MQQLPIKQTTRNILKGLPSNPFKIFLGLILSAKRCKLGQIALYLFATYWYK
jgi:hypothetical protein